MFVDSTDKKYKFSTLIAGPDTPNDQTANIELGGRPKDSVEKPPFTSAGVRYTIASFHGHTPTRHATGGRNVGPSPEDDEADKRHDVAGIVYDYDPPNFPSLWIKAGYAIENKADRWDTERTFRMTPE